jgi:RNA polymerase sigma factor (TIGR02999 family)
VASQSVTALLLAFIPIIYKERHRLARRHIAGERSGHPLQTTALVHEAYLRLIDAGQIQWQSRAHCFAVSANIMRRILVDYARGQNMAKRGGQLVHNSLDFAGLSAEETACVLDVSVRTVLAD